MFPNRLDTDQATRSGALTTGWRDMRWRERIFRSLRQYNSAVFVSALTGRGLDIMDHDSFRSGKAVAAASARLAFVVLCLVADRREHRQRQDRRADPRRRIPEFRRAVTGALHYRLVGSHKGSLVTAVAGPRGEVLTFYMGAAGGGAWKTTDAGETCLNVSDSYFANKLLGGKAPSAVQPYALTAATYTGSGKSLTRTWDISLGPEIIGQAQTARVSVGGEALTVDFPRRSAASRPASRLVYRRLE